MIYLIYIKESQPNVLVAAKYIFHLTESDKQNIYDLFIMIIIYLVNKHYIFSLLSVYIKIINV